MALAFTWLTPDFATSAQLTADDIAQAVAAGFLSGINNRPEFRGGPSPTTSPAIQQGDAAPRRG